MILGATIKLKDQFTGTMGKVTKQTQKMRKDSEIATTSVSKLTSKIKILGKTVARPVIKLKDQATSGLKKIKDNLTSLKALAAVALAGLGMSALGGSTLGAAMKREQQMVSMEHFIGIQNQGMSEADVKKEAQQYVGWLNKYANLTPFETGEIIAGGARAINVSGGDVTKAREIMKIAGDMAALNPEKTFSDAMEALADLKTGETERMKEFGFKITQDDIKKAGGAENVMLGQIAPFFKGGAEKLGKTGAGLWSTITGQISENFAVAGEGILEGLKPQLQWVADFFDKRGPAMGEKAEKIGKTIGNAITTVRPIIQNIMDFIRPGVTWIKEQIPAIKSMWETAWPTISSVLSTAWSIAQPIFSIIIDTIKIIWGLFEKAWPVISGVVETAWGIMKPIFDALGKGLDLVAKGVKWVAEKFNASPTEVEVVGQELKSHAAGLVKVPYDNYPALLHKGERVLTRAEADQYRKQVKPADMLQTVRQNVVPFKQRQPESLQQMVQQQIKPVTAQKPADMLQTVRQNVVPFKPSKLPSVTQNILQRVIPAGPVKYPPIKTERKTGIATVETRTEGKTVNKRDGNNINININAQDKTPRQIIDELIPELELALANV